ncbi:MAG: hypothetical protein V9H26_26815 [Verrucomicrobiota bacterium]
MVRATNSSPNARRNCLDATTSPNASANSTWTVANHPVNGAPLRVISCHLGGSSSVTGIHNGVSIGTSMGMSPQSGLPQNNRVGDLDAEAIPYAVKTLRHHY